MRGANIRVKNLYRKNFSQVFCSLSISITNILLKDPFQNSLIQWYLRNKRDLPWRHSHNPYHIWLSEVILQQTRIDQGTPYYLKFIKNYPRVEDLASADQDRVLKDWEGLGYYSRARNLQSAAKQIVEDYNGEFPNTYEKLVKLKGVGDYTASAISSIVYNEPQAVLDGNVFRVLSRYFGIDEAINTAAGQKVFKAKADEVLYHDDPGTFNQALMEFGALQCVPRKPDCDSCVLRSGCRALAQGRVAELPQKQKKVYNRKRYLNYAILYFGGELYIEKRTTAGIWHNLYQFWLVETDEAIKPAELFNDWEKNGLRKARLRATHSLKPHKLSHQSLHITVLEVDLTEVPRFLGTSNGLWVPAEQLKTYAFPRPLRAFLDRNQLTLPLH